MVKSVKRGNRHTESTPPVDDLPASEQTTQGTRRRALTGWPMIIGWAAMLMFALHACTHMVAAGDTWVAMACGRHFVNHGVDTVEPFSANSHKPGPTPEEIETWPGWAQWIANKVGLKVVKACHPTGWINQNWLTHMMFYLLVPKSSYSDGVNFTSNALVYWKFAVYILTIICVYYTGRLLGVNPALCAVFSCFALFAGRSYIDIRPAGFSNMLVAVFLLILALATYRNILYIWLIVPVTVFWCNVHGGYIYVFIMLIPFIGLHFFTNFNRKWTAILYNVTAWPFLYIVLSRAGLTLSTFLFSVLLIVLDFVLIFSKKILVSIGWKGVVHAIAAYFAAFFAAVIFNPFHLTNFTHTFVISVSKHAERWRDIHEWQSAFDWDNRVGTAFPFLVLYILSIGLLILWVFCRFLIPRLFKAPKNELEAQSRRYTILSTILSLAACILGAWVTFVSFSFLGLDAGSFFVCALFTLILIRSIYRNIHFIYLVIPLILLALWAGEALPGYNGRYIYPFIIVPAYVTLHIVASLISKTVKYQAKNILFVAATAAVGLLLMTLIFNPFKFDRPVWYVQQFLGLQRLARPIYERNVGLGYGRLFDGLYMVNVLAVSVWLAIPYFRILFAKVGGRLKAEGFGDGPAVEETFQLPKIDLGLMVVSALTIYMAVRSRRFIPIAAIAACPVVAMLLEQVICAFSASRNFYGRNRLAVSNMPRSVQIFLISAGALVVLGLGIAWSLKFKCVYLDPWPSDPKLNSVFMRMTASDAKPFYAMKFVRDNKLAGKMFNYWTEGGFIAWGQDPDPKTGRTPLQLFMDGRAQAAYNVSTFDLWSDIMAGGQITKEIYQRTEARGQSMTAADYAQIGQWMDQQMQAHDIWVVLMPAEVFADPDRDIKYYAIKGLEYNLNWRLVFLNREQKLFVDIRTPRGKELFEGIFTGRTIYPDDYHGDLIRAHSYYLYMPDLADRKKGFDFAVAAFHLEPSATPMLEIMAYGAKYLELKPEVDKVCEAYLQEFTQNKDKWARQDGFRLRIEAARLACYHLKIIARARRETDAANAYAVREDECLNELVDLSASKRW
jgi:hypothetical protein